MLKKLKRILIAISAIVAAFTLNLTNIEAAKQKLCSAFELFCNENTAEEPEEEKWDVRCGTHDNLLTCEETECKPPTKAGYVWMPAYTWNEPPRKSCNTEGAKLVEAKDIGKDPEKSVCWYLRADAGRTNCGVSMTIHAFQKKGPK